jgi:hypothetical protein
MELTWLIGQSMVAKLSLGLHKSHFDLDFVRTNQVELRFPGPRLRLVEQRDWLIWR